jgi:hypothetical protein
VEAKLISPPTYLQNRQSLKYHFYWV